jgi:hypothetical protein
MCSHKLYVPVSANYPSYKKITCVLLPLRLILQRAFVSRIEVTFYYGTQT